jgi:hypothetical protein
MVVCHLQGGLGNQMFQYATGLALSKRVEQELFVDLSHYTIENGALNETPRSCELDLFNLKVPFISENQIRDIRKELQHLPILKRLKRKVFSSSKLFQYNDNTNAEQIPLNFEHYYLHGYFHNETHFLSVKNELTNAFQPAEKFPISNLSLVPDSVSVHIRRGDYISNTNAAKHHGTCSLDYYNDAFDLVRSKISNPHFYFFSDDVEWCKINFKEMSSATFVENDNKKKSHEDLILMRSCEHQIIANSSYSWWAAWLNTNRKKIVVCPKKWTLQQVSEFNTVVPSLWIQI